MIQELKNHLHQVLKFSENSLLRTKQEAEKQQKADYRASQGRVAKIQQDTLQLRSQFHNLVMENREAEQALRKVPWEPPGSGDRVEGAQPGGQGCPSRQEAQGGAGVPWEAGGCGARAWGQRRSVLLPHTPSVIWGRFPRSPGPGRDDETHLSVPYKGPKGACEPQANTEPQFPQL